MMVNKFYVNHVMSNVEHVRLPVLIVRHALDQIEDQFHHVLALHHIITIKITFASLAI